MYYLANLSFVCRRTHRMDHGDVMNSDLTKNWPRMVHFPLTNFLHILTHRSMSLWRHFEVFKSCRNVQFEVCEWAHKMYADFKQCCCIVLVSVNPLALLAPLFCTFLSGEPGGGAILTNVHTIHRESCWCSIDVGKFMKFSLPKLSHIC